MISRQPGERRTLGAFMYRCRTHRLLTSFVMVCSLLFSQLALAQYVCPGQASLESMAEAMASGQSCDGMDLQQPALCHQHAADAGKNFEAAKLPTLSLPLILQVLELPLVPEAAASTGVPEAATSEAQPPPDPIYLSTLRLRV
jgi:hypothetical protein